MTQPKRLYRDPDRGVLAGVCAGLADYLDVDVTVVRVVTVLIFVFTGFFPLAVAYVVMWVVVPRRPASPPPPGETPPPPSG